MFWMVIPHGVVLSNNLMPTLQIIAVRKGELCGNKPQEWKIRWNELRWMKKSTRLRSGKRFYDIVIQRFSETEECMVNLANEKDYPPGNDHISPSGKRKIIDSKWSAERECCWWFRNPANHLRVVVYPIICKVFFIPGGCEGDFWTINSMWSFLRKLECRIARSS